MRKYRLFSEWSNADLYGDSIWDALDNCGRLTRPARIENGAMVEPEQHYRVLRMLGYEDVTSITRGNDIFKRVVVDLFDNPTCPDFRAAIDYVEMGELQPVE